MHIELPLPKEQENLYSYLQQLVSLLQLYINATCQPPSKTK